MAAKNATKKVKCDEGIQRCYGEVGMSRGDVMCFRYRESGKTLFQR